MSDLRKELIRIAHDNPHLRDALLPLLKEASTANDLFYQWGRSAPKVAHTYEKQIWDSRYVRQFWSLLSDNMMLLASALEEIGTKEASKLARDVRKAGAGARASWISSVS